MALPSPADLVTSFGRPPAFPIKNIPAQLPTIPISSSINHLGIAEKCLSKLSTNNLSVFASSCHWRDMLAFTSTMRTFNTVTAVTTAWKDCVKLVNPQDFEIVEGSSQIVRVSHVNFISARFRFNVYPYSREFKSGSARKGKCLGVMKMVPVEKNGEENELEERVGGRSETEYKIWVLSTMLEEIEGWGNPDIFPPELLSQKEHEVKEPNVQRAIAGAEMKNDWSEDKVLDAVVVGLGPAGLATIARLKALGLSAIGCEKFPAVGMNWTERYKCLRIHTPKIMNTLPFNFKPPREAPQYSYMEDLKEYYESFVQEYELEDDLWFGTPVESAKWDETTHVWTVGVNMQGMWKETKARHLIFCIGMTGYVPIMPIYPGRELFKGDVIHAMDYNSAEKLTGKRGVVIGSANSAHDIAEDMLNAGMDTTMVQRNPTPVIGVESFPVYNIYHEDADVTDIDKSYNTNPLAVDRLMIKNLIESINEQDKIKYEKLEEKGFRIDREADVTHIIFERMGGHYLDVGVSQLIIDGKIHVKSDSRISSFNSTGLLFENGSTLDADVIVFATGYEVNMKPNVEKIVGKDVAEQLDDCWQLDDEGQPRGSWKPIGHPNIWYCPGSLALSRFFSRFVVLQVKAEVEGNPFVPYTTRFPQ